MLRKCGRKAERGVHVIQLMGLMVIFLMVSVMGVDAGVYFSSQNQLQTAADSGALAGAIELATAEGMSHQDREQMVSAVSKDLADFNMLEATTISTNDVALGYVNPQTARYDEASFSTSGNEPELDFTGGFNAVRVVAKRTQDSEGGPIISLMGRLLGLQSMDSAAMAVALLNQNIVSVNNGGLRPIYACQAQFEKAAEDGILSNNVIRVYNDRLEVDGQVIPGCPEPGSGNWGFADLRDCDPGAPGASNTVGWFKNGFPGTVQADNCKSTQPGNFLSNSGMADALSELVANETVILIPLYDGYAGGGSNTEVDISGFAGFVITGYVNTGNQANRYIEGYFTRAVCNSACQTGPAGDGANGSVTSVRLASPS